MLEYKIAETAAEYEAAAILFKEYAAWLNIDLCFQGFDKELETLAQMYGRANGGIILCKESDGYLGCVAIRRINDTDAEMKRMWVQRDHQGRGIGNLLLQKAIELSKKCGYKKIRLDTLSNMTPAINLYRKNGFVEIDAYYHNPDKRAVYFEKIL